MMKKLVPMTLLCLGLGLVACTDDEKKVEEVVQTQTDQKSDAEKFSVDDKTGKVTFEAEVVYFAFDDYTLTDAGEKQLGALADYLKANPEKKLKISGHADARGSTEYNLALGEKRSQAVKKYLADLGIGADRLDTISYGSEKPAVQGEGEEAWSKNRRAEFTMFEK